jgi:hypothetical protein
VSSSGFSDVLMIDGGREGVGEEIMVVGGVLLSVMRQDSDTWTGGEIESVQPGFWSSGKRAAFFLIMRSLSISQVIVVVVGGVVGLLKGGECCCCFCASNPILMRGRTRIFGVLNFCVFLLWLLGDRYGRDKKSGVC